MRIVITGIGVVSAIGSNCAETLSAVRAESSGIDALHLLPSIHHLPVGEVKLSDDDLRQEMHLTKSLLPRTALLGIKAAREALADAGLSPTDDMAFLSGTTVGGMEQTENYWNAWHEGQQLQWQSVHTAGATTQAIADHLGSFGYISTPSTACSSALNAIMIGANLMRTGRARRALVGGSECLSRFHLNGFNSLMILDDKPCRPFDATRAGLNLGEGAGFLVLENEEDAHARGAHIWAYIGGYGNACDAHHQTASSEDGEGAYRAMQQALLMAGIQPQKVDYVNAHGTGTPNNDASESAAIRRLFGSQLPPVSSTKGLTGHTTSASGSIETIISLLAMQNGFIPGNKNWTQGADNLIAPVAHLQEARLQYVLCNAFGFGGNDSSLLLSAKPIDLPIGTPTSTAVVADINLSEPVDYKQHISPMEARRMTPQVRQLLVAAMQALETAGGTTPDAIICSTDWGCMQCSVRFLQQMIDQQEESMNPTQFIQSTHNTIASLVAIRTANHGYNMTYSQGKEGFEHAALDAEMQMELGLINSALLLEFDERVDALPNFGSPINIAHARLIINQKSKIKNQKSKIINPFSSSCHSEPKGGISPCIPLKKIFR